MAFIRLSDNYIDNPKFTALSDGAFRLWHEAMAFCRKHQTDGVIPPVNMHQFPSYTLKRLQELLKPWHLGANPLLATLAAGYAIHDYLTWNLSKADAKAENDEAAKRMRAFRRRRGSVTSGVTGAVTSGEVPDMDTDRIFGKRVREKTIGDVGRLQGGITP